MKIFLSWSGQVSHDIAEKLHKWLPMVIQKIEPYISSEIEKGTRWSSDIAQQLEQCTFGIACVTAENKEAPWLLFEAGALSKSVSDGRLAPILFGLEQSDIQKSPLTQFQMTKFEKYEFFKLLQSINDAIDSSLDSEILNSLFEALWPKLELDISQILDALSVSSAPEPAFDPSKILGAMEELLTNSRSISQILARPDRLVPEEYLEHIFRRSDRYSSRTQSYPRRVDSIIAHAIDELHQVRDEAGEILKQRLDEIVRWLDEARHYIRRDRDVRYTSLETSQKGHADINQRIRDYASSNPDALQQDIAQALNVNQGRISEALKDQP